VSVRVYLPRSLPTEERRRRIAALVRAGGWYTWPESWHKATLRCAADLVVLEGGRLALTDRGRGILAVDWDEVKP